MRKALSWLRDENNRGIVSLISGGIAICVAALWSVYLYIYPPSKSAEVTLERTILVCTGDKKVRCPSNAIFAGCEPGAINQVAADTCGDLKDALIKRLFELPGGRCGYAITEVKCRITN